MIKRLMLLTSLVLLVIFGVVAQGAATTVTMKFPATISTFIDRDGNSVRPDASGNAAVPTDQIASYMAAGFSFYSDYLYEGSINVFYTNARARAAVSSTATGLTYTGSTGVFSLAAGYVIPRSTHPEDVGGFANAMTTLGDLTYGGASGVATQLAGNTAATKMFLSQTGTGAVSAAPAWAALGSGDIPDISSTYLTAAQKAAASGVASLDGSSKVVQDPANATATPTGSKIPIANASGNLNDWYTPTTPLTSYAAGTAYSLTATPAQTVFGTTSPALTVTSAGTWAIRYRAHVKYTGATFAANQTATLKLRRTNNTAADLANSPATAVTNIVTTETGTLAWIEGEVIYTTANTDDVIQLWGSLSDTPAAGSLDVVEANIVAVATK